MATMKNDFKDSMSDNEIRVLGNNNIPSGILISEPEQKIKQERAKMSLESERERKICPSEFKDNNSHGCMWICVILVVTMVCVVSTWLLTRSKASLQQPTPDETLVADTLSVETLKDSVNHGPAYTLVGDTTINDIPLRIFTPVGGRMELVVSHHPEKEKDVILAVHAADLRGDDGTPAGAFVHRGELLAKGHSKYGFCAIVDSTVSIGRQIATPLFEQAIEQNGSFFRQYSIVSNGKLMSIPPKGKAQRRALCLVDNVFMIVESTSSESYHDFSQALVDFGVSEALSLVGADASVMWREESGQLQQSGQVFGDSYPLENYIVWRTK